jgi:site-specific DNA-methyltransferase (adenine-specific)
MKYKMNKIYNEDCLGAMKQMPDNYFELAVPDLEYCIGASKPSIKPNKAVQKNGTILNIKQPKYEQKEWDFKLSSTDYLDELFRVSKNQIIWGGNYYGLKGGYIVWDKLNGESDQFGCEMAYCSFNRRTDIVYYMWAGMFQGIYCGKDVRRALIQQGNKKLNEERIHPTQKPVALYKWLLKNYAKEGDKILDTHLGSASSIIACIDMGFDFMGFELDEDYYNAAKKRVTNHLNQGDLTRDLKFSTVVL